MAATQKNCLLQEILVLCLSCVAISFAQGAVEFHCVNFEHTICKEVLSYTEGFFPNVLNISDPSITRLHLQYLAPLLETECGEHLKPLLCSMFYPECDGSNTTIPPCAALCLKATKGCEEDLEAIGLAGLNCSRFPESGNCYAGKPKAEKETNIVKTGGNDTNASTSCNCDETDANEDKNQPSDCVLGDYNCRQATARGYINGKTVCCLDNKQLSYTSSCAANGQHESSCRCAYNSPPGSKTC